MAPSLHLPTPASVRDLGARGLDLRQEFTSAYTRGELHTMADYRSDDPALRLAAAEMYAELVKLDVARSIDRPGLGSSPRFSTVSGDGFRRAMMGAAAAGTLLLLTGCGDDETTRDCVDANDNVVPENYCDDDDGNGGGGGFFFLYSGGGYGSQKVRASDKAGVRAAQSKFSSGKSFKGFSSSPVGGKGGVGAG